MGAAEIIIVAGFVALIVLGIVWKKTKGRRGEKQVAALLSLLPKDKYKVINNLLLQSGGYSTQIDHVVVSVYGIFVIETKYYKGWIYGGENSEFWTKNVYGHKYELRNPLWQNKGHIKAITRLLDDPGLAPIHSIVAFSHQARLKVDRCLPVMYWHQVVPYIRRYQEPVLSESDVDEVYHTLLSANIEDREAEKQHVKSVKQNKQRRDIAVASGRCPRCGGELILRKGMYGRFYGCSNYPKCTYILNK